MVVVDRVPSTRERLLAAALAVFREQGYERARVADIARAAGMTTGAIYANYRDKAELLLAAIAAGTAAEVRSLLEAAADLPPRAVLEALGSRIATPQHARPLLLDAVVASTRDPELATLLRELVDRRHAQFADLVERGRADGTLDSTLSSAAISRLCMTLALGSLVTRALDLEAPDPAEWDALVARLLDALTPTETTR